MVANEWRMALIVGLGLIVAACSEEDADTAMQGEEPVGPAPEVEAMAEMETVEVQQEGPTLPSRTYDARTFFETTSAFIASASGFPFSPDGGEVLASWDRSGIFNAYALPIDGSEPRPLTASDENSTFAVSFFPSDGRVLVSADQGGNELSHVYVRQEDGVLTDLTPGENVKASFAGWKQDMTEFYVTTNERDARYFDLYAYSTDGYERRMVFQNDAGYQPSAVSPDDRYLALTLSRTSADSDIFLVDLQTEGAEPTLITEHEGNIAYGVYDFTPDSSKLVYSTNENGEFAQAWTYDIGTAERTEYVSADWDVSFVAFSQSGNYRVTGVNADARTEVTITRLDSGEAIGLPDLPPGQIASVRFSPDDKLVAFSLTSDTAPANIFVVDLEQQTYRQLTETENEEIEQTDLVTPEVVRYESFDGLEIPSILYRPHQSKNGEPVPALVWVHGGPGGQSRTGYSPVIQHLVNHGYAVLAANNRGSSGYGKTFFHMDDRKHGEVDLQDIVYGQKYLASLDWVDGDRIGIIGGSYGGYMVMAALAFEPDVFDVGIDIFGVTNWQRTLKSIPPWWESAREALYDEMGDPATDEERHYRISPLFHAANIVAPTLVVQGANDPRVLQVESDEMVEAIRANDVPVEYVIFPDEGHGFLKRENRITASDAYVQFLDQYLK